MLWSEKWHGMAWYGNGRQDDDENGRNLSSSIEPVNHSSIYFQTSCQIHPSTTLPSYRHAHPQSYLPSRVHDVLDSVHAHTGTFRKRNEKLGDRYKFVTPKHWLNYITHICVFFCICTYIACAKWKRKRKFFQQNIIWFGSEDGGRWWKCWRKLVTKNT